MSNIKKDIIDNIITPNENIKYKSIIANVVDYNNITNRATISFEDPYNLGISEIKNVPVSIPGAGVYCNTLNKDDEVYIEFQNNSPLLPKIVGIADEEYQSNTREKLKHDKQNTLMPKKLIDNNFKKINVNLDNIETKEIIKDWFNTGNEHLNYIYKDKQPHKDILELISNISYYDNNEIGLTHPINKSSLHIKNNGNINIYVDDNIGISVNKDNKSININCKDYKIHCNDIEIACNSLTINNKKVM